MDREWIVGRKEIMAALHVETWNSVRCWKSRLGVQFVTWPNGSPAIQRRVFNDYIIKGSKLARDRYNKRALNFMPLLKELGHGSGVPKRKQEDI